MKDIVYMVVFTSCVQALLPLAKSKAIRSALSLLFGVALLSVICAPLGRAAESIRDFPRYVAEYLSPAQKEMEKAETDSEKWVIRYGVKNIERGIQKMVTSRFALSSGTVYVEIDTGMTGEGAVSVDRIHVYLTADAACDDGAVERYISDMLACPCKVIRGERIQSG